jgi:branched-chain amino acid transport system ATP-binding protein
VSQSAEPVLACRGLIKRYGGLVATDNLSLDVRPGEIHAVIGPNGAGKTTALGQVAGELTPDDGTILLGGRDVTALSMPSRARLGIARSFQVSAVFDDFTVAANVATAVQARARHHFFFFRKADRDPALTGPAVQLLRQLGLEDVAGQRAGELSHGQRRQLEIAMALATEPRLLLLDEPMAGLGDAESRDVVALLESLRKRCSILLVEHDMEVVFRLADTVTVLVNGAAIASGPPGVIREDAGVRSAYLEEGA